jgi:hypothetical protein
LLLLFVLEELFEEDGLIASERTKGVDR